MNKRLVLLLVIVFAVSTNAHAQRGFGSNGSSSCGTDGIMKEVLKDASINNINNQIELRLRQYKQSGLRPLNPLATITLPVVVHVIHNNGVENISDARILAGIQHLNEAFANSGYYDPSTGVNTNIQFCLAQRDPNGQVTTGITRNASTYTNMSGPYHSSDDINVKDINRWDPNCYINIWLVNNIPGSVAGYAYLPAAHGLNMDGILMEAAFFGSGYSDDVVIIHEMGHYLGLYHTFEQGCTNNDCTSDGDKVCDTPPDNSTSVTSCNLTVNSCATDVLSGFATDQNDITQDYLDYGNWDCMSVFTQGQADRMNWHTLNVRSSLMNCKSCSPPCPTPVTANFTTSTNTAPAGTNISFTNTSVNGASWSWYVNDVLVSNAFNLSQQFSPQGTYSIKLKVESSNPGFCLTREKTDTVIITCSTNASFTPGYNGISTIGKNIAFTNTSTDAISNEWYYDNNLVSTSLYYTASFNVLGNHYVKLKAKGLYCIDSMSVYYVVNAPAIPNLSFQKWCFSNSYKSISTLITPDQNILHIGGNSTIAKLTGSGNLIWSKTYLLTNPNISSLVIKKAISLNDGNMVFIGNVRNPVIMKTDVNGNIIWNKFFFEPDQVVLTDIAELPDGNFIISGQNYFFGHLLFYKINPAGDLLWRKTIAYSGFGFQGAGLHLHGNELYFSSGIYDPGVSPVSWGGFIMKLNPVNADILWGKKYNYKSGIMKFNKIRTLGDNLVIDGDYDYYLPTLQSKKTLLSTDTEGNVKHFKLIDFPDMYAWPGTPNLCVDFEGKILLAITDSGSYKTNLLVFDSSLSFLKGKSYPQIYSSVPADIDQFSNGDYLLSETRRDESTILARLLPDLTKPPCASTDFTPHIQDDIPIVTDISSRLAYSANFPQTDSVLALEVQENNVGAIDECSFNTSPVCDTTVCNTYYLSAPASICHLSDTLKIILNKNENCSLVPAWIVSGTAGHQIISQSDSFITLKVTTNGSILVRVKSMNACKIFEDSLAVDVKISPKNIDLGQDIKLCNASTIQLSAGTGFKSYLWHDKSVDSTFTAYFPGTYHVTATDYCGNIYSDSINIILAPAIVFDLGPGKEICAKDTIIISAPAGFSNYIWSPEYAMDNAYAQTVKLFPKVDTIYTVTATKALGCTVLDSIRIKVHPVRKVNLGNDSSFCQGGSIILNAGNNFDSYQWNTGSIEQSIRASFAGLYSIAATDSNGCVARDTLRITEVYPKPIINMGNDRNICQNDSLILNAGNGFKSYLWQDNSANQTFTVHTTGKYWVAAKTDHNCISRDTINILNTIQNPTITLGTDTSFCNGQSILLSPGADFTSYTWQDNSHNQNFIATQQGQYSVIVKDVNNCSARDTLNVIALYPKPLLNIGKDTVLCKGQAVTLNAGTGFTRYLWHDNSTEQFFSVNAKGYYWVKVFNNAGCFSVDTLQITGLINPPINFIQPSYSICDNRREYINSVGKYNSYLWSDGTTLDAVSILTPGSYWLIVKDVYGCEAKESFEVVRKDCVEALYFPNAFSPNNDNVNETFKPTLFGNIEEYHLKIYNRYGIKVFETTDIMKGWNGYTNNAHQSTGAYVWACIFKLKSQAKQTKSGTLVLVR